MVNSIPGYRLICLLGRRKRGTSSASGGTRDTLHRDRPASSISIASPFRPMPTLLEENSVAQRARESWRIVDAPKSERRARPRGGEVSIRDEASGSLGGLPSVVSRDLFVAVAVNEEKARKGASEGVAGTVARAGI
ncbi:hypothetical protein KM043_003953 [Ampulex compressa]|nr:hypothetical protein KM043_003953 [Ampulex compressa]